MKEAVKLVPQGEIAFVEFDLPGSSANKFSTPVMMRLKEVLEELARSSYKAVVFVSNKPKIFIAGADIEEIQALKTPEQLFAAVQGGQEIMNMVEDLPMVTVAAVHGACLGGGCEFILACDYRIASEDKATRIGLPEVQLGIIPGFGGCVRLPRVVGLQGALEIILAGKSVDAKKAQKMGLVDMVVHPSLLRSYAVKFAKENISSGKRRKQYRPVGLVNWLLEGPLKAIVYSQARKNVLKQTHGHYPAPLKALEVIKETYRMTDRNRALEIERKGFGDVGISDVSKNLIHVYYLTEMVKKSSGVPGKEVKARDVNYLGILGAGTMGGGIAYVAADKGIRVRMKDLNLEAVGRGLKHARDLWMKLLKRKKIDKYEFQQRLD
ncbi:MAG: enoyl-CoA hydratase-related protein, partial [Bdellovibrionaceae bacterium]|nr:enoyl-CoA hydratase-related protein [Pseudobdellovibrionaceae bacterium]